MGVELKGEDRASAFRRFGELQRELAGLSERLGLRPASVPHSSGDPLGVEAYQLLGEHGSDMVSVHAANGDYLFASPNAKSLFGWKPEELVGTSAYAYFHESDVERIAADHAAQERGEARPIRYRFRCGDGSYRRVETRSHARAGAGGVEHIVCLTTDVEEDEVRREQRKKFKQKLQISERMAVLGTLAASIGHEINNPLTYVLGNLECAVDDLDACLGDGMAPPELAELRELLAEALEGSRRIGRTVRGLRVFSRTETVQVGLVSVNQVLELSLSLVVNEVRHRARVVKDLGESPLVRADEGRLAQVFVQLIVNAAQAMPPRPVSENEIHIVTRSQEGQCVVEIRDNGAGMREGIVEQVFDPFFTTKPVGVGTGLGLSICHGVITALGGEIAVESREGEGTTFTIFLPPAPKGAAPAQPSVPAAQAMERRARILVVDDEQFVRDILERSLGRTHDVTAVADAKLALRQVVENEKPFDLILCDLMMPGMTGMEFFEKLTQEYPQMKDRVVFITGGAFSPEAHSFVRSVPNLCLEKPFELQRLKNVIAEVLG